jgi:hypothetical protein
MDRAEAVIPAHGARAAAATGPREAEHTAAGRRFRNPGARLDPYLLAVVFFVAYALLSVTRYRRMLTMSWDLGIFEQAIKSYAHLQAPVADLKGPGFNILGDHFSPITALIAPFYRVFPTPVTLLIAQAVLFAVAVIPVTRGTAYLLGRGRGLAVGVAYGLSWGVQKAVEFDFHEIAFAMPLLAFSLEAVLRKRWAAAMWWAVPLVFVKEDMGITAAAIGVIVWWRTRQETDPEPAPQVAAERESDPAAPEGERGPALLPQQNDTGVLKGRAAGDSGEGSGEDSGGEPADDESGGRIGAGVERISDALRFGPWAIGLISFGVAASALAFAVIIPAFNSAGGYDYWNS